MQFKNGERYLLMPFNTKQFDFVSIIENLFNTKNLSTIHFSSFERYTDLFEIGKDSSTIFHQTFYDKYRAGWNELENLYLEFITYLQPILFNEEILYQKFPTFRVHLPGNVAVGAFHNDAEFHHPEGEINFIIPLTNSFENASVWVESEPNKKDFESIQMKLGHLIIFNGNKLTHGNKVNDTLGTRVSMDFRILPISKYKESDALESMTKKTKFVEGEYYKRLNK